MRSIVLALATLLACAAGAATARPFTVDDLLQLEDFGAVAFDPTGERVVIERRGPYEGAASFDRQHGNPLGATRLLLAQVEGRGSPRLLMPQPAGCGYLAGPWSPDGRRLAVYRLCGRTWELGVATVSSGSVRWLDLTPASNKTGRSVQWRSAERLLVLARPFDDPPWELRTGWQTAGRLPARWAAAAEGRAAVTVVGSGDHRQITPRPSPSRLLEVDLAGGGRRTLAVGDFVDLELSPDGGQAALLEMGERLQPNADRPPQGPWGMATEAYHLAVLDLSSRRIVRPCPACDVLEAPLSWSPGGGQLLVYVRTPGSPWTEGRFHIFSSETRALQPVDAAAFTPQLQFRPEAIETGWLDETPLARGRTAGGGSRSDWWALSSGGARNLTAALPSGPTDLFVGSGELFAIAGADLWSITLDGAARPTALSKVERLTPLRSRTSSRLGFIAPAIGAVLLRGPDGALHRGDGGRLAMTLPAGGQLAALAPEGRSLVERRSLSILGEAQLRLRRAGTEAQPLTSINARLAGVDPPDVAPIRHAGPNGEARTSWLYSPRATKAAPPPLIVRPYLGEAPDVAPGFRAPTLGLIADIRTLVGRGYAVLVPALPLPITAREPLAGLSERVLGAVDAAAVQAPGAFDPSRLALWGHSYGGYTTLGVVGQTNRFKAAIVMNAPTDLISLYGAFPMSVRVSPEDGVWPSWTAGFAENAQGRMGAPPWLEPERYVRNSPLFLAGEIQTPIMLVHGDQDPISLAQSEELFSALHRQNKDAVLVTYWGEGHVVSSPGNVRDLYARGFAWLEDHLQSGERGGRR